MLLHVQNQPGMTRCMQTLLDASVIVRNQVAVYSL